MSYWSCLPEEWVFDEIETHNICQQKDLTSRENESPKTQKLAREFAGELTRDSISGILVQLRMQFSLSKQP